MKRYNKFLSNKIKETYKNKFACIIGSNPSSGARSPKLWNKAFKRLKMSLSMIPFDVKEKNLEKLVKILKSDDKFIGGSVTIPYKSKIMKYLDKIDENSKIIGSINTIKKLKNGKLFGFNTDFEGCCKTLKRIRIKKNNKILVLGIGGVGKAAVISVLKIFKKNPIYLFNRSQNNLRKFFNNMSYKNLNIIENFGKLRNLKDVELVINATSVGFDCWFNKEKNFYNLKYFSPLSSIKKIKYVHSMDEKQFISKNEFLIQENFSNSYKFFKNNNNVKVFDIIYNPKKTVIQKICESFNNKIFNGSEMNLDQAVIAFAKVNEYKNYKKIQKFMLKQNR